MAVVCPSCGVENRDKARFCLGCAASLDRPVDAAPDAVVRPPRKRRVSRTAQGTGGEKASGRGVALKAGWLGALVLIAGLGWWLLGHQPKTVASAAAAPLAPTLAQPFPADVLPVAASPGPALGEPVVPPPSPAALSAAERLRESVEGLAQRDRAHQQELEQRRVKLTQDRQRADEARRKTDALAAAAAAGASAPVASAPVSATVSPALAPAAVTAAAAPSIDQLCAGSGNFLARDFCRIRECGKPTFASDPVCVRFRQMDEARRQQSN